MKETDRRHRRIICYFGAFDRGYARNQVISKGLERVGFRVSFCTTPRQRFPSRYFRLTRSFMRDVRHCHAILVGEGRHLDLPLARLLAAATNKRVILDAFISHYDTQIVDRATFGPHSRQAWMLALADRWGARLAHAVLLDTQEHIDYYSRRYNISGSHFRRVFVGADDTVYRPRPPCPPKPLFEVLFYGTYIPLHGIDIILEAAKLLQRERDILFKLVGRGDTYECCVELRDQLGLENVVFCPPTTNHGIADHLAHCDVSLGVFGTSGKASRVIPNKAFQTLAMRKPLITADTPAARELLIHREHALLCNLGDPASLAAAILDLKGNEHLLRSISESGYDLFLRRLTPEAVVEPLVHLLEELE